MERQAPTRSLFEQLTSAEVLTELVAVAIAIGVSAAAAHFIRAWFRRIESRLDPEGWQWKLLEGGVVIAPFFVALLVLLPLRASLAALDAHVAAVDVALQLVAALLFVRLGVYVFALLMGNKSWVRAWENQITIALWLTISFELLGWFDRLGVPARGLPVLARPDAGSSDHATAVAESRFTYLVGGSPMHLRSVLKDSLVWAALLAASADGATVAGSSAGAMVLCDPMVDPRGGAFTLGLGLVTQFHTQPRALGGDVDDAVHVQAEDDAALQHRGGVVQVHDGLLGALDRLVGSLDQVVAGLGQYLDDHVVRDQVVLDQLSDEVEVGLARGGEADLDLLVAHAHQQLEHAALALGAHGIDQGLVAVAQVDGRPLRGSGDPLRRPGAVGQRDGDLLVERLVPVNGHAGRLLGVVHGSSPHGCVIRSNQDGGRHARIPRGGWTGLEAPAAATKEQPRHAHPTTVQHTPTKPAHAPQRPVHAPQMTQDKLVLPVWRDTCGA